MNNFFLTDRKFEAGRTLLVAALIIGIALFVVGILIFVYPTQSYLACRSSSAG